MFNSVKRFLVVLVALAGFALIPQSASATTCAQSGQFRECRNLLPYWRNSKRVGMRCRERSCRHARIQRVEHLHMYYQLHPLHRKSMRKVGDLRGSILQLTEEAAALAD